MQDPNAEKAALENAADQSLAEVAASMGLSLAELLGQQPPPAEEDHEDSGAAEAGPSQSQGVGTNDVGDLPEAPSLPSQERQGKRTRRMAAEEQASAEAAKKAAEGYPDGDKSATLLESSGVGGVSAPGAANAGSKTRAAKRARSVSSAGRGSSPGARDKGDGSGVETSRKALRSDSKGPSKVPTADSERTDKRSTKERAAGGPSTRHTSLHSGEHEEQPASKHGNDQEGGRGASAVPKGAHLSHTHDGDKGAEKESGGKKGWEASEAEKEGAGVKASEVRAALRQPCHVVSEIMLFLAFSGFWFMKLIKSMLASGDYGTKQDSRNEDGNTLGSVINFGNAMIFMEDIRSPVKP